MRTYPCAQSQFSVYVKTSTDQNMVCPCFQVQLDVDVACPKEPVRAFDKWLQFAFLDNDEVKVPLRRTVDLLEISGVVFREGDDGMRGSWKREGD